MATTEESSVLADHPSAQFIVLMSMLTIFSVVGSIGNGLVIFVFQRVREKTTAQIFIIAMAIIDLFTCTVIIPFTVLMEYTAFNIKYDSLCKLYHFLITSKIPLSAFIMVAIAFDRYFCICHPLTRVITIFRAKLIVVALALLASVFGVITSLFYGVDVEIYRIDGHNLSDNLTNTLGVALNTVILDSKSPAYEGIWHRLVDSIRANNNSIIEWDVFNGSLPLTKEVMYLGICHTSTLILDPEVFHPYHKSYTALFAMCLITVMVLYFLIYRFMCARRSKKLKQKLVMCSYMNGEGMYLNTLGTTLVKEDENGANETCGLTSGQQASTRVQVLDEENGGVLGVHGDQIDARDCLPDKHLLSPLMCTRSGGRALSSSLSVLSGPVDNDLPTNTTSISASNSCANIEDSTKHAAGGAGGRGEGNGLLARASSEVASSGSHNSIQLETGSASGGRTYRQEQKYRWYKKRDSVKRYKGKKRDRRAGQRGSSGSRDHDPDRLREQNRKANVKTAIMLFTVSLVFVIAFVPSWVMAHRLIPFEQIIFYFYFSYNVANPFIYAFMNHIFKAYMRKVFSCKQNTFILTRSK